MLYFTQKEMIHNPQYATSTNLSCSWLHILISTKPILPENQQLSSGMEGVSVSKCKHEYIHGGQAAYINRCAVCAQYCRVPMGKPMCRYGFVQVWVVGAQCGAHAQYTHMHTHPHTHPLTCSPTHTILVHLLVCDYYEQTIYNFIMMSHYMFF